MAGSAPLQHGPVAASQVGEWPDLVLIHGLAGSGDWWPHNQAALTAAFRVTTIDLPCFGTSHPEARLILDEVPGQVAALMRGQGIGRALLETAIELSRQRGAAGIDLNTGETDTAARGLYESMVFTNREGGPDGPSMLFYEREI